MNRRTGPDHNQYRHGLTATPTYKSWSGMKARCKRKDLRGYENWGGRGISYDPRWEDFVLFLEDMGIKPDGLTLERVDNDKGYSKDNCIWANRTVQSRNRRYVKLSPEAAKEMRKMRSEGSTYEAIGISFGVAMSHAKRVCDGHAWAE